MTKKKSDKNKNKPAKDKPANATEFVEAYLDSDSSDGLDEYGKCVQSYNAGLAAGKSELAEQFMSLLEQTRKVTEADLANGKTIDMLIRNTAEELGEFCKAVAVEDGHKKGTLAESSRCEAVDTIICALSLYFGRGGKMDFLTEYFVKKLSKWEKRVKEQAAK